MIYPKNFLQLILSVSVFIVPSGAGAGAADAANPVVRITTSMGEMEIELNPKAAPKTVENFLKYVNDGFYNGTIFHRVMKAFMIQGGGFTPGMKHKEASAPIENEANNGLKNRRGSIAMARTGDPHSASSQFFINAKDNAFLDHTAKTPDGWGYTVFGMLTKGMKTLEAIEGVATGTQSGHGDVPKEDVIIEKVEVIQ
ncbi:MAG: peptidyl-prolyl cis-trans isomerase [Gammaproteobacteria bacterium]|nr:peptidyl-prolyl cis-trans isomerase [Gammaproteobacteria bacterium]